MKDMKDKTKTIPFSSIPHEDLVWASSQTGAVIKVWHQSWIADPFGSRWVEFTTDLCEKSFRIARKVLTDAGLFLFRPQKSTGDARVTETWLCLNLHGKNVKEFWEINNTEDIENTKGIELDKDGKTVPPISQKIPSTGKSIPKSESKKNSKGKNTVESGENIPMNQSENVDTEGVSEPIKNNKNNEEHLINLPKEDLLDDELPPTTPYPTGGVVEEVVEEKKKDDRNIGDILNDLKSGLFSKCSGLASFLEKKVTGTTEPSKEENVINAFGSASWRPDNDRIQWYLNLDNVEKNLGLSRFNYRIRERRLSNKQAFDESFGYSEYNNSRAKEEYARNQRELAQVWMNAY